MDITHELYAEEGKYLAFADNDIAITCKTGDNDFPEGASLTQVVIVVEINGVKHPFNAEIGNNDSVTINIAKAWQVEYSKKPVLVDDSGYVVLHGKVAAYKKWLEKGSLEMSESAVQTVFDNNVHVLRGGLDESEIWNESLSQNTAVSKYANRLSTKPIPEVVNNGDVMKVSTYKAGTMVVETVDVKAELNKQYSSALVEDDNMRKCLYFVNRFGVVEHASALMLEKQKYDTTTMRSRWEMSSGYVTRAWAKWWITEFLRGKKSTIRGQKPSFLPQRDAKYWLKLDNGKLLPVNIEFDESADVYDKAKQDMVEVKFEVVSELKG